MDILHLRVIGLFKLINDWSEMGPINPDCVKPSLTTLLPELLHHLLTVNKEHDLGLPLFLKLKWQNVLHQYHFEHSYIRFSI